MSAKDSLYFNSPVFLQNLLVSGYGYYLKRLRYGGEHDRFYRNLLASQFLSAQEMEKLQTGLFTNLVIHAAGTVPYYKRFLDENGISPLDISLDNYRSIFPILTKEHLRTRTTDFVSRGTSDSRHYTINTSGTSGTPLTITAYRSSLQRNYAFFRRMLNWAGIELGERSVTFAGRVLIPGHQRNGPYWRHNKAFNNLLLSSYHISRETIPAYIRALERHKPIFIDSYPSAIYEIARYILENDVQHEIAPRAIITSSETLYDHQRLAIENAFKCKVFDHLGSAEMSVLISQCEFGSYHANPEYGLLEVVDDDCNPVATGKTGRLVATGLFNFAMPLIRYDLGDSVSLSDDECECGRNFPLVKAIQGRTDDLIIGCDGQRIGRLDPIFKGLDNTIKETQIIQENLKNITIRMVVDKSYQNNSAQKIINELKKRIGECININIEYVQSIPKTNSGKFQAVISRLGHP